MRRTGAAFRVLVAGADVGKRLTGASTETEFDGCKGEEDDPLRGIRRE